MRLELKDITKQFPGVLANDRITISADRGEVLGLLGENGAGKTTLMNILSGLYKPDSGEILIDGTPRTFTDPRQAIDAGIGMVHQHFQLVPVFDVVEAVALGAESVTRPLGTFDRKTARKRIVELSDAVQPQRQPGRDDRGPPRRRPPAGRDPQGALPQERHPRPRRAVGGADAVRDGGAVRHHPRARRGRHDGHLHHPQAQRGARGRRPDHRPAPRPRRRHRRPQGRDPRASSRTSWSAATSSSGRRKGPAHPATSCSSSQDVHVRDDREHMTVKGVNLEIRAGEIVALAGVQGNGQTELVEAIVGLRTVDSGEITLDGDEHHEGDAAPDRRLGRRPHPRGPEPRRADRRA